jgi:small subunit ribosomal protein S6
MDNKIINAYELLFITDVTNGIEAAEATANKFVARVEKNGEIIDVTTWGKRRLEYPINDKNEGFYTIVTFRAPAEYPHELERRLNIDESVMRSLIIKLDEAQAEKVARHAADKAAAAAAPVVEETAEEAPAEEAAPAADAE